MSLTAKLFYTAEEIAVMFGKNLRWVRRHSAKPTVAPDGTVIRAGGFLAPARREFGRTVLFLREEIDKLIREGAPLN